MTNVPYKLLLFLLLPVSAFAQTWGTVNATRIHIAGPNLDETNWLRLIPDTSTAGGITDTLPMVTGTPDSGYFLMYNGHNRWIWEPIAAGTGAVDTVKNTDGTLTISPVVGTVIASLNLAHKNTWSAAIDIAPATDDTPLVVHANNSAGEVPLATFWSSGGSPTKLLQFGDDGEIILGPTAAIIDGTGSAGSAGQVLESQGSSTLTPLWTTLSINNSIYSDTVLNNTLTFCDTIQAGEHDNFRHTTNNIYYYATMDASSVLTGIDTSLQNGYFLCIQNQSQRPNGIIVLDNENTASKPQNRIMTGIGKDLVIARFENALLVYVPKYDTDAGGVGDTVGRWVVVGGTAYERNSTENTNYIWNQFSAAQTSSNFWIDGTGQVGTLNVYPGSSYNEGTITTTTTTPLTSFNYTLPYAGGSFVLDSAGVGGGVLGAGSGISIAHTPGHTIISATGGGGMTNPMTTLGDIIYEDATPTPARLAGNTNNYIESLTSTASSGVAQAPAWSVLPGTTYGISTDWFAGGAGNSSITGGTSTIIGSGAGASMTTGGDNVALGYQALNKCKTAGENTALGTQALFNANSGSSNGYRCVAVGMQAGYNLTNGYNNIFIGSESGTPITSGHADIFIGRESGLYSSASLSNTCIIGGADDAGVVDIYDVYLGGNGDIAKTAHAATSVTWHGSGANGTNLAGGNVTIASGKGTGTGTPGALKFDLPVPGSSGTTLQSLQQVGSISALGSDAKLVNYTIGGSLNNGMPQVIIVPDTVEANNTTGGITIPGASDVKITHGSETGAFKITMPTGTEGQLLTIDNATSYCAGFATGTGIIQPGETRHYEFLSGAWQDLNPWTTHDIMLLQTVVIHTAGVPLNNNQTLYTFPAQGFIDFVPTRVVFECTSIAGAGATGQVEIGWAAAPTGICGATSMPTSVGNAVMVLSSINTIGNIALAGPATPLISTVTTVSTYATQDIIAKIYGTIE